MKRIAAALAAFFFCASAHAQLLTLGAGKGGGAAAPAANCSAFLPAAFSSSNLYISWATQAPDTSWGMACLNGTSAVAANTLGTFSGAAAAGSTGLVLTGGFFQFTNVTWLAQGSGTLYENLTLTSAAGTIVLLSVSDGSTNNQALLRSFTSTLRGAETISASTIANTNSALTTATATNYKIAFSYTNGSQIVCVNGGNNGTTSGAGSISGLNAANVGASPTGTQITQGTITETAFFSTALASTAACDTLTTP